MEVAAGDGKLIKLSLIYPSPRGRPRTRHFSLLYLRSRPLPLPPSSPRSPRSPSLPFIPPSFALSSRYLPVALFLLLFVSLRLRAPSHTGFEAAETKRLNISIWHQPPLLSMPRSSTLIYISLSRHPPSIYPVRRAFSRPIRLSPCQVARPPDAKGRRLPPLVGRKGESGGTKGGSRGWRMAESARGGPTSMEWGRKSERKIEKSLEYQEEATG